MFARKIRVEYEEDHRIVPCPLKWLDSFSMRNFTNASAFDDTLPLSDGQMEIGSTVPLDQLKDAHGGLVSAQGLPAQGFTPVTRREVKTRRGWVPDQRLWQLSRVVLLSVDMFSKNS